MGLIRSSQHSCCSFQWTWRKWLRISPTFLWLCPTSHSSPWKTWMRLFIFWMQLSRCINVNLWWWSRKCSLIMQRCNIVNYIFF